MSASEKSNPNNPDPEQPEPAWLVERHFISAPSDPAQLTLEDARTVFAGDLSALKDIAKIAMLKHQENQSDAP